MFKRQPAWLVGECVSKDETIKLPSDTGSMRARLCLRSTARQIGEVEDPKISELWEFTECL